MSNYLDINTIKTNNLYKKYIVYAIPTVIILITIIIMFNIFIPNILSSETLRREIEDKEFRNSKLEKSAEVIKNYSESSLDEGFKVVNNTLLGMKDFSLIYKGIKKSAEDAKVNLNSFALRVGKVFPEGEIDSTKLQNINLILKMNASSDNIESLMDYVKELYTNIPISETKVIGINSNGNGYSGQYEVEFFYRPYKYNLDLLIKNYSINITPQEHEKLLKYIEENRLGEWLQLK